MQCSFEKKLSKEGEKADRAGSWQAGSWQLLSDNWLLKKKNVLCCRSTAGFREFHKFCRSRDVGPYSYR